MDKAGETRTEAQIWADKAVKHRKTCETCTNRYVCDDMAEINAKVLETTIFGL